MPNLTWGGIEMIPTPPPEHTVCRQLRPATYPERLFVPDDFLPWAIMFPGYEERRPDFTDPKVLKNYPNGWAQNPNVLDARSEIESYYPLLFSNKGYPLNPAGRTGLGPGRGELGKWGANFAADPIVTYDRDGEIYLISILRDDGGGWALPGGMTEKGEPLGGTLKRELGEETSADLDMDLGTFIYAGYVDDRRNTDSAWIETFGVHRHIDGPIPIKAGDDAKKAKWAKLTRGFISQMYASHPLFVRRALSSLAKSRNDLRGKISELIAA